MKAHKREGVCGILTLKVKERSGLNSRGLPSFVFYIYNNPMIWVIVKDWSWTT